MESLFHFHLFSHLESLNILCEQQHGFFPGRSCESQLITTYNYKCIGGEVLKKAGL